MTTHLLEQFFDKNTARPPAFSISAGQCRVRFHFPNEALAQYFSPPFHHLLAQSTTADLDIFCFLDPLDVAAWLRKNGLENKPHKTYRQGGIRYCSQENGLFWLDESERKGYFVGNDMDAFEPYRSKPISRLLCWFFENKGMLWCHGACIGNQDGGVLLPGIGGAGKSTTVGAALLGGLRFLGDDYLLVAPHRRTVHGLYSSLMLAADSSAMLHRQFPNAGLPSPEFLGNKDKWCHYLHPVFQGQLGAELPLKSILIPQLVEGANVFISPCSRGEVMNALVSSLQTTWLMGLDPAPQLRAFYQLTQNLPFAKLNVGSDLTQVAPLIRAYLSGLALNHAASSPLETAQSLET